MSKVRQDMEPEVRQNPQLLNLGRTKLAGGVGVPQTKGFQNFKLYIFSLSLFFFRERGGGREIEKHRCVRETSVGCQLPLACPQLGTWPTAQACALTGN